MLMRLRRSGRAGVSLALGTTWGLFSMLEPAKARSLLWRLYLLTRKRDSMNSQLRRPIIFIAIPKSASKTIANRLAHAMKSSVHLVGIKRGKGLWPGNTAIPFGKLLLAVIKGKVAHEHLVADKETVAKLSRVASSVVVHVRDPRQVLISMAHPFIEAGAEVARFGVNPKKIDRDNMTEMFDYLIETVFPVLVKYVNDWVNVSRGGPVEVAFLQYEQFIVNPSAYFSALAKAIGDPDLKITSGYSQHYRKGKIDEWRDVLTNRQQVIVNSGIPRELREQFGWPAT